MFSKPQEKEEEKYQPFDPNQEIVPLRTKSYNAYASALIGAKVYDSPEAKQILGFVKNFVFAPVKHNYDSKSDGDIVGIEISDSRYPILNPESLYWWLNQKSNDAFAVLKGKPEPKYYLDNTIAIGDVIRRDSRKFPLVEATVSGSVFCSALCNVDRFPETRRFMSEYTFVDEFCLDYGDKRWIAITRREAPEAIDFKNKVLLKKPTELKFRTKEEVDKILEEANKPHEGPREWGGESW
jgi:hypothetical protein